MSRLKRIINSIGNLFNIMPDTNYYKYVPKESDWDRVGMAFEDTGKAMNKALEDFKNEKNKKD